MPPIAPISIGTARSFGSTGTTTKQAERRHASTSILFALSSLSNSRETQHFNKLTKLSRVEHSPPLQLIRSGEVEPYPLPELSRRPALFAFQPGNGRRRDAATLCNSRSLAVGRAVLAQQAKQIAHLQRALRRSQRRELLRETAVEKERRQWQKQERKMRDDMRVAGFWIVASVGTSTGLALWRFWPQTSGGGVDSGQLGRKIAERAKAVVPLSATRSSSTSDEVSPATRATMPTPVVAGAFAAMPAVESAAVQKPASVAIVPSTLGKGLFSTESSWSNWMKGFFWKQV